MTGGSGAVRKTVPPPHQRSLGAGMAGCLRRMAWAAREGTPERSELRDTYHSHTVGQPDALQGHLVLKCSLAEICLHSVSYSRTSQNASPKLQCCILQCGLVIWVPLATESPLPSSLLLPLSPLYPPAPSPSSLLPPTSFFTPPPPLFPPVLRLELGVEKVENNARV